MSLYHIDTLPYYSYGIWKIEEDEASLRQASGCIAPSTLSNPVRRAEYLAVRALAKRMGIKAETINYLPSGKPYLANDTRTISISHTKDYVAVMLSRLPLAGIDIETRSPRVMRVRHKYMHPEEEHQLVASGIDETVGLLLHWCIKEAIFKAIPEEGVDFAQEIRVTELSCLDGTWHFTGKSFRSNTPFQVNYLIGPAFVLTCCYSI
ncbi:MAG: 4'-phosphopantetheinyl transferase superfamily protein [Bacteroidota bacterium]|nr:4'-phosphopantetheinyl transferase superfamily protein [Bacteroidota bacterium]